MGEGGGGEGVLPISDSYKTSENSDQPMQSSTNAQHDLGVPKTYKSWLAYS